MSDVLNAINIYTDGSWKKRIGGFGFVIYHPDGTKKEYHIPGLRETTINAMELRACIEAVKVLQNEYKKYDSIEYLQNCAYIHSDSQYVVDNYKNALYGDLTKRGATTSSGLDYANVVLWKTLLREIKKSGFRIEIKKTTAHKGIEGNVIADRLAKESRRFANKKDVSRPPNRTRSPLKIKEIKVDEIKIKQSFILYIINTLPRIEKYTAGVQILKPKKYFGVRLKIIGKIDSQTLHIGHIYKIKLINDEFKNFAIDKIIKDLGRPSDNKNLYEKTI